MKTLVYSLLIFASFFSVAEQMAKISKNGSVFIVPNRDGNDPLEGKQYTLLYGGKQYCGTVSQVGRPEVPSIYEICKPEYVSAFKFSKAVKIDQKVFPIGLVVEGCGAVPEKTSISVDDPKVVSMKKNMGWENKKYDQQTAHQLNTSNKSYLLFEGIYFKEDKKDKFKSLTLADVAVFEPSSNNILIKDESLTCCDPSQFGDCAYKRFAIKMCMPLSANLEIEGLFNSKSQLKGYSIGGISEGAHVFTWKFENENRKESYHNYAYAVGGCE